MGPSMAPVIKAIPIARPTAPIVPIAARDLLWPRSRQSSAATRLGTMVMKSTT
jgi:hypothetical protein